MSAGIDNPAISEVDPAFIPTTAELDRAGLAIHHQDLENVQQGHRPHRRRGRFGLLFPSQFPFFRLQVLANGAQQLFEGVGFAKNGYPAGSPVGSIGDLILLAREKNERDPLKVGYRMDDLSELREIEV